jgi:hypothetical protein
LVGIVVTRVVFEVEEMRAEEDEHLLSVSFGFGSQLSEFDVLFIVCGKTADEQDLRRGLDGLYFERFDQLYSCYNAAESISVSEDAVALDLTPEGSRQLGLPALVSFDCRSVAAEFRVARKVFGKMAEYEWAKAIIAPPAE